EWIKNLFVRFGYQQRHATREFVIDPVNDLLTFSNKGQSHYHEFQITTRYRFKDSNEFVASYVRSSARGDLNDFNSYFGNFENPIIQRNEISHLSWDAPNRFLFWGNVAAKHGITIAPVLDLRSGFPLSITDAERNFVGPRNETYHFPEFF